MFDDDQHEYYEPFVDQEREHYEFQYSTQADWHRAWHWENGRDACCPWDCAESDPSLDPASYENEPGPIMFVVLFSPGYCEGRNGNYALYEDHPMCACHKFGPPWVGDPDAPF